MQLPLLAGADRAQPALEKLRTAIREERECRVVLRNYRSDGALFWNELYIAPVFDEEGRLRKFVGVQNDVTEIKRAEEVLAESENRLRLAVKSTGLGIWDFDPLTRRSKWDEWCKELFGLPPETEVDYYIFLSRLHPDNSERTDRIVQRALDPENGGEYNVEYRTLGPEGGGKRWVAARGQALFDERGRVVRFIGTVLDITERKREEERDLLLAREQLARAEVVKARRRLALLASVGPILYSQLDYETTIERIAHLATPELADWSLFDILEEDGSVNQLAAAHADPQRRGLLRELRAHRRFDEHAPGIVVARVLRTGRPVLITEASDSLLAQSATGEEQLRLLRELEICSLISVPLLARGRTLGAMTLVSSSPQRRYNEEDLALAENLAYRCALAVDNARLYRDRSYIACTLQRSLLPRLPEIAEIEVGVEYLPVGEESEVGGDFYDLIEVDDCWMAVIGDVCGKGAAAAALTALTRYTIRAVVMREDRPSAVLLALNETMIRQLEGDQFRTVACARLRPADGSGFELTVARGGQHPAPLLLRAGAPSRGWIPGKALGAFPDPGLGDRTHRLRTGETMVLYTDGVVEARGPDGSFLARSGWRTSCVPPARGSRPRPSPKG